MAPRYRVAVVLRSQVYNPLAALGINALMDHRRPVRPDQGAGYNPTQSIFLRLREFADGERKKARLANVTRVSKVLKLFG